MLARSIQLSMSDTSLALNQQSCTFRSVHGLRSEFKRTQVLIALRLQVDAHARIKQFCDSRDIGCSSCEMNAMRPIRLIRFQVPRESIVTESAEGCSRVS